VTFRPDTGSLDHGESVAVRVSTGDSSASLVVTVAPSADDRTPSGSDDGPGDAGTAETPGGTEAPGQPGLGVGTAIAALAVLAAALRRRG